ncbi:MAG: hypothetical protein JWN76_1241 [Chitinophagaceae bacterium]|nr:hypothetical protein [Chitinophagaceae bacterium]
MGNPIGNGSLVASVEDATKRQPLQQISDAIHEYLGEQVVDSAGDKILKSLKKYWLVIILSLAALITGIVLLCKGKKRVNINPFKKSLYKKPRN